MLNVIKEFACERDFGWCRQEKNEVVTADPEAHENTRLDRATIEGDMFQTIGSYTSENCWTKHFKPPEGREWEEGYDMETARLVAPQNEGGEGGNVDLPTQ